MKIFCRSIRFIFICMLTVAAALLLTSCTENNTIDQDPNVLDSQQYLPETVYIGSLLPEEDSSNRTSQLRAAQEVAVDIINNSHDIPWDVAQNTGIAGYGNATVELVPRSISTEPRATAEMATELSELGVSALLGAYRTDYTQLAATRARSFELPLLCGSTQADSLTDPTQNDFGGWFFRIASTVRMETELYLSYLRQLNQTQNANISSVALIYRDDSEGQELAAIFNELAESYGYTVAANLSYPVDTETVAVEMQTIITSGAQAVFHLGSAAELTRFAEAYHTANFTPTAAFCYGDAFQDSTFSSMVRSKEVNYWHGLSLFHNLGLTDDTNDAAEVFTYINNLYRAKTNVNIDDTALLEFAAVIVMAQAAGQAGSTDAHALQAALLEGTYAAPYLTGQSIDFDENGQNIIHQGYVMQLQDGTYTEVYRP